MKTFRGIIGYRIIVILLAAFLVAAIMLISILYRGTYQISTLSEGKTLCFLQASLTCNKTSMLPVSWKTKNIRIGFQTLSCYDITGCLNCTCCEV